MVNYESKGYKLFEEFCGYDATTLSELREFLKPLSIELMSEMDNVLLTKPKFMSLPTYTEFMRIYNLKVMHREDEIENPIIEPDCDVCLECDSESEEYSDAVSFLSETEEEEESESEEESSQEEESEIQSETSEEIKPEKKEYVAINKPYKKPREIYESSPYNIDIKNLWEIKDMENVNIPYGELARKYKGYTDFMNHYDKAEGIHPLVYQFKKICRNNNFKIVTPANTSHIYYRLMAKKRKEIQVELLRAYNVLKTEYEKQKATHKIKETKKNNEYLKERTNCECGAEYSNRTKSRHLATAKHIKFMNQQV